MEEIALDQNAANICLLLLLLYLDHIHLQQF